MPSSGPGPKDAGRLAVLGPARPSSRGTGAYEDSSAEGSLGRKLRACVTGGWAVCAQRLGEGQASGWGGAGPGTEPGDRAREQGRGHILGPVPEGPWRRSPAGREGGRPLPQHGRAQDDRAGGGGAWGLVQRVAGRAWRKPWRRGEGAAEGPLGFLVPPAGQRAGAGGPALTAEPSLEVLSPL